MRTAYLFKLRSDPSHKVVIADNIADAFDKIVEKYPKGEFDVKTQSFDLIN